MLMVMKADERCSGQNDLVDSPTWSRSMPGTLLFLSHDASRTGAPIFLLNFLRWLHARGGLSACQEGSAGRHCTPGSAKLD